MTRFSESVFFNNASHAPAGDAAAAEKADLGNLPEWNLAIFIRLPTARN